MYWLLLKIWILKYRKQFVDLKNTIFFINNVRTKRDVNIQVLKTLNDNLFESKKRNKLTMNSYQKSDNLGVGCMKIIQ